MAQPPDQQPQPGPGSDQTAPQQFGWNQQGQGWPAQQGDGHQSAGQFGGGVPPTQPLPAQGPGAAQPQANPPGQQPPPYGPPGQQPPGYGPPGQPQTPPPGYGPAGQPQTSPPGYGPAGQPQTSPPGYGPPAQPFGYPPQGPGYGPQPVAGYGAQGPGYAGPGFGAAPGIGGPQPPVGPKKGSKTPLLIAGGVVGALVIALVGAFLLRPAAITANPSPSASVPAPATPGATVTAAPTSAAPAPTESTPTWTPKAGECNPILTKGQCAVAKTIGGWHILVETCLPDPAQVKESGIVCDPTSARKLKGDAKLYAHKSSSAADLKKDINRFFTSLGIPLYKVKYDLAKPPAMGQWFFRDSRNVTRGVFLLADAKGAGHVGWTFTSKRVMAEVVAQGVKATAVNAWWKRKTF